MRYKNETIITCMKQFLQGKNQRKPQAITNVLLSNLYGQLKLAQT